MPQRARLIDLEPSQQQPEKSEHRTIQLGSRGKVVVRSGEKEDLLEIVAPTGEITISVRLTESGPILSMKGVGLEINSADSITLNAQRVEINAGQEALLKSEGTLRVESSEKMSIRCEDDLRVVGKLIYLN